MRNLAHQKQRQNMSELEEIKLNIIMHLKQAIIKLVTMELSDVSYYCYRAKRECDDNFFLAMDEDLATLMSQLRKEHSIRLHLIQTLLTAQDYAYRYRFGELRFLCKEAEKLSNKYQATLCRTSDKIDDTVP